MVNSSGECTGYMRSTYDFNLFSVEARADVLGRFAADPLEGPIRDKRGQIVADLMESVLYQDAEADIECVTSRVQGIIGVVQHYVLIRTKGISTSKMDEMYDNAVEANKSFEKVS
jgi:hypothetical protein